MNFTLHERESEQILSVLGSVLRRRKILLSVCVLGMLALVFYYNETAPHIYEAAASVVFEELKDPVPDDVTQKLSWEVYLFNRIEEVNSRAFAEDIVTDLPEESLARFPLPKKMSPDFDRMRYVTDLIAEGISAYPLRNSNIVRIRVRLSDARLCLLVANLSLKVLDERSGELRKKGVANLREFVEDQLVRSAAQLAVSEGDLRSFKETNGITSLEADSREMLKRMTEAEVLHNSTLAEVGDTKQRLGAVRKTIASERKELGRTVPNIAGSSIQKLREKWLRLETESAELLLQKYPDDHPAAVQLRQEIEQTRKDLKDETMKLADSTNIGDPIPRIERRVEESVTLQIDVEGLEARANALKQTVERYRKWLNSLPEKEMELARLERQKDVNERVYMSLLERREEIRVAEHKQLPSSRVIDRPLLPIKPIEPRKLLNVGLGGVLSLVLGLGLGFVLESRAGRLGSMLEFEEETGWPVLASIPHVRGGPVRRGKVKASLWPQRGAQAKRGNALVALDDPETVAGEAYSMLRTRLELLGMGTKYQSLLVTSCGPGDGKSSTLSNVAASFGAVGRATIVVDAEFRRPTIHTIFGVDRSPGLADLLLSRNNESLLQKTQFRGVTVLASGNQTQESSWEVSWPALRENLEDLKRSYEIVLVDSPPPVLVHDTLRLCGMVDAVIVVVDARSYDAQRLMEAKLLLERAGANVIGAVLNKTNAPDRYGYGYRRD